MTDLKDKIMKYGPYSHSRITTYLHCKNKFNLKYVKEIQADLKLSDALIKGKEWHGYIEDYLKNGNINPIIKDIIETNTVLKDINKLEIVGIEVEVDYLGYVRGFIDCLLYNKATNKYIIVDWKTGKAKTEEEAIKNLDQIGVYALWVRDHYGSNISGIYNYIEHNRIIKIDYTEEKLANIKNKLDSLINEIENASDEALNEKNESFLCRYCEYKNICYQ